MKQRRVFAHLCRSMIYLALAWLGITVAQGNLFAVGMSPRATALTKQRLEGVLQAAQLSTNPTDKLALVNRVVNEIDRTTELSIVYPDWVKRVKSIRSGLMGIASSRTSAPTVAVQATTETGTSVASDQNSEQKTSPLIDFTTYSASQIDEYVTKIIKQANVVNKDVDVFFELGAQDYSQADDFWKRKHIHDTIEDLRKILSVHQIVSLYHQKKLEEKWQGPALQEIQQDLKIADPAYARKKINEEVSYWILFDLFENRPPVLNDYRTYFTQEVDRAINLFIQAFNARKNAEVSERMNEHITLISAAVGKENSFKALGVKTEDDFIRLMIKPEKLAVNKESLLKVIKPTQKEQLNSLFTQFNELLTKYEQVRNDLKDAQMSFRRLSGLSTVSATSVQDSSLAMKIKQKPQEEGLLPWKKVIKTLITMAVIGGVVKVGLDVKRKHDSGKDWLNALSEVTTDYSKTSIAVLECIKNFFVSKGTKPQANK